MSLNYLQPKPTKTMINDAAKLPTLTCNRLANKSEETKNHTALSSLFTKSTFMVADAGREDSLTDGKIN